jgi:hypothetical protein
VGDATSARGAVGRSTSPRAAPADVPSERATPTVGGAPPADTSQTTFDERMPEVLAPRPRTWGDCLREGWGDGQPCPWVSCAHHLLVEVAHSEKRGQGLRLMVVQDGWTRPKVSRPATQHGVDAFADRAVEALARRRDSCELRVAERVRLAGRVLPLRRLAAALGVNVRQALADLRAAQLAARSGARRADIAPTTAQPGVIIRRASVRQRAEIIRDRGHCPSATPAKNPDFRGKAETPGDS